MRDLIPDVEMISYEGLPDKICDSVPDRCADDVLKFPERRFGKAFVVISASVRRTDGRTALL
jgi:S-adenosylmethionine synthetase